jgi:hypothetical protein
MFFRKLILQPSESQQDKVSGFPEPHERIFFRFVKQKRQFSNQKSVICFFHLIFIQRQYHRLFIIYNVTLFVHANQSYF